MENISATIGDLLPGVPFYRANPEDNNHNVLPDYNVNLNDDPNTIVWVCFPKGYKNQFIKSDCNA